MALTTDQIKNAPAYLDEVTQGLYYVLFQDNKAYMDNAFIYSADVVDRLAAASNTLKGRMLNALMRQIDKLGTGVVSIKGDDDALYWSQKDERDALVTEALNVLYDKSEAINYIDYGFVDINNGLYGDIAIGARTVPCSRHNAFMCRDCNAWLL